MIGGIIVLGMLVGVGLFIYSTMNIDAHNKAKGDDDDFMMGVSEDQNIPLQVYGKKYSEIVFATARNMFITPPKGMKAKGMKDTLTNGIRVLVFSIHFTDTNKDKIAICHNVCTSGATDIASVFTEIASFLNDFPNNIITII